ncbi:MAG: alpha/beta hydrolase [Clostridia bacterium]|nr:alpha/beta hydrolase [Clostridia bacterium]
MKRYPSTFVSFSYIIYAMDMCFRSKFIKYVVLLMVLAMVLALAGCDRIFSKPIDTDGTGPSVTQKASYSVRITRGMVYGEGLSHAAQGSEESEVIELLLDLYEPLNAPDGRPAIILIHGGGLKTGSRQHGPIVSMAKYFAARGWVAVSIDYRLADDYGTVPDDWEEAIESLPLFKQTNVPYAIYPAVRDAKAAVRWLYANADEYHVNTDYITVAGGSAGAYISVAMGVTDDEYFLDEMSMAEDPTLESCNTEQPSAVHTIIDFWGGPGMANAVKYVNNIQVFDENDPPILIIHGDSDDVVSFDEAERLVEIYEGIGVPYELHRLKGAPHSAWNEKIKGKGLDEVAFEFIVAQQDLALEK